MAEKLTKSLIDSLPLVETGQVTVMDTLTPGFGIRVGAKSKTFIVVKRLPHKTPQRVTLGRYGALTVETARKAAIEALGKLSGGVDINTSKKLVKEEKKAVEEEKVALEERDKETLSWLFNEYRDNQLIKSKGGKASDSTLYSFEYCFKMFCERECETLKYLDKKKVWVEDGKVKLDNWLDRPLRSITDAEVLERFEVMEITKPSKVVGGKLAPMVRTHQLTFKFAQCAFDWYIPRRFLASGKKELVDNPFKILNTFKKWKQTGVRKRIVDFQNAKEFGPWWTALQKYREINEVAADYIEFSILQAGRSIEIVPLTWDSVNFDKEVITYEGTKNTLDYVVPMSARAKEILLRRKKNNPKKVKWVWHYPASETGHVPKDMKHHFQQLESLGAKYISSHDLKRTWASAAHSLPEFRERDINYLLKHKESDVNQHYFIKAEKTLRNIIQSVEDLFVKCAQGYEDSEIAG